MVIDPTTRIYFGAALKKLLKDKKMSQGDVHRATGMDRASISRFISDRIPYPRLYTVARIAKAVGMTLSDFVAVSCQITEEINNE